MAQFVLLKSLGFVSSQFSVNYKKNVESLNRQTSGFHNFACEKKFLQMWSTLRKDAELLITKFCLPKSFVLLPENTNPLAEESKKKIMHNYEKTLNNRSKK